MIMIQFDIVSYKMIQYEIKLHNFIIVSYNKFNIVQTILYHDNYDIVSYTCNTIL